ncbi:GCN5-related protein N-acetyltransferase [Beutenbergia cavernae DSM 12333]|uniref:GCN5-related protein N-acetyltransferase n=1 Tax=Beutenbergia cavernae (strain ATCC BAA-8 / DSM 12333 / CCUG 43141 / JCM 11478 / NBRC 16432 / NCIMB 13614 / HKI 0122) TaxID=471853 RepID=C5C5S2_BEUC1|nr:GNAT family N-acetyltransferase [Beutenbergia cavernae]ACQ80263.1 GCN5-related protein N-acetyltransferase [Beutenbergia cavernae DSM 12333]
MTGAAPLPDAWAAHPLLVADTGRWVPSSVWSTHDAFLAVVSGVESGVRSLLGLGAPAPLAALLTQVAAESGADTPWAAGLDVTRASFTRGAWEAAPAGLRAHSGLERVSNWDWFVADAGSLRTPAAPDAAGAVERLEASRRADVDRIAALHAEVLPTSSFTPDRTDVTWTGWVAGGELLAVAGAADRPRASQLGGVATHPTARGRGIGAAVVSAAARAAAERRELVCLGMYADNHAARGLYTRLGFAVGQEFTSFERAGG